MIVSAPQSSPTDFFTLLNEGHIGRAITLITHWSPQRQQQARSVIRHTASSLLTDHHVDAALALMTPYQQQWPQDIEGRQLLARGLLASGQFTAAITLLTASIPLTADQTALHALHDLLALAIARYDALLRQRDQRNTLLDFYRQLAANDGGNVQYQFKQAQLLVEMGQLTEASALLQPLLFGNNSVTQFAHQLQRTIDQQLAQQFTDTIALTRLDNHFLVPVQIDGDIFMLLLDTGASLTLLSKTLANRSTKQETITLATANGTVTVPTMVVAQVQLGHQVLHHISVALTKNMGIGGADGLLGMDILKRFHFVIDQEHATLRLTPRAQP